MYFNEMIVYKTTVETYNQNRVILHKTKPNCTQKKHVWCV